MAWIESASPSFRARHESEHAGDARRVLDSLEQTRRRLSELFAAVPSDVTIVLHDGIAHLSLAAPLLPLHWWATAPAARRYVVGWVSQSDIHMLAPEILRGRASNVPGSRAMLERSAACLYARRVILSSNPDLTRVMPPLRAQRALRWAWLLEGVACWFGGQTEHARPAIARRLREDGRGGAVRFPPSLADAPLLGGTVIDLLVRERGERAAIRLASRLHPRGPHAALRQAFGGESLVRIEDAWRSHLARLATGQ